MAREESLMKTLRVGRYMAADPGVCHGKLTFKGTRVPVETVLTFLARGASLDEILRDWPELTRAAVAEAITLASNALAERYAVPAGPRHEPVRAR
jgi:uncharacterized protein (DUF433 family)